MRSGLAPSIRIMTRSAALAALLCAGAAQAAEDTTMEAVLGPWRATNDCFLSAFNVLADGHVETVYLNGERDGRAHWTFEEGMLTIASGLFAEDSFEGVVMGNVIEAEFVWHDLDRDELNPQQCRFERFIPGAGT